MRQFNTLNYNPEIFGGGEHLQEKHLQEVRLKSLKDRLLKDFIMNNRHNLANYKGQSFYAKNNKDKNYHLYKPISEIDDESNQRYHYYEDNIKRNSFFNRLLRKNNIDKNLQVLENPYNDEKKLEEDIYMYLNRRSKMSKSQIRNLRKFFGDYDNLLSDQELQQKAKEYNIKRLFLNEKDKNSNTRALPINASQFLRMLSNFMPYIDAGMSYNKTNLSNEQQQVLLDAIEKNKKTGNYDSNTKTGVISYNDIFSDVENDFTAQTILRGKNNRPKLDIIPDYLKGNESLQKIENGINTLYDSSAVIYDALTNPESQIATLTGGITYMEDEDGNYHFYDKYDFQKAFENKQEDESWYVKPRRWLGEIDDIDNKMLDKSIKRQIRFSLDPRKDGLKSRKK